ncbi:MAG: TlpA disulfide reductase family protein [Gemmatimonadaceae bacterium]|nr:TlpA disulfide reductase family protein [Gemmatimonadaceae bacterium]
MRALLALLTVVCVAACSRPETEKAPAAYRPPTVGDSAPAFTVAILGGDSARIGTGGAQPVTLVNIWATWCGPCKAEFPELQALHSTYAPRGLRLLAVSIDDPGMDAEVAESAKAMGATFAIGRDPADQVRGQMGAVGIPESWLVSADGRLLWKHSGAIPAGDLAVRAAIDAALGNASGTR